MIRPALLVLLSCALLTGTAVDIDPAAASALQEGNAALEAANNDPSQNLVAALAYAKALPAYEVAGDLDTAAELRSVIFWCKKRMNQATLERFVQSKGEAGQVLATAVAQVDQPVAASEATAYLAKADVFAKKYPDQFLKIAIRYFEVADRFQGTQESLKAQRLSLEALQQSMATQRLTDPAVTAKLHSTPIVAGDLPESAQKLVADSNQVTDTIAAKASRDLLQDRQKAVEVILKEAEAAQRRGDLEQMITHQTQAADLDKDVSGLSKAAGTAVETYRKARPKIISKAAGEVIAERKKVLGALARAQKDETKKGNTAGALALKATIDALTRSLDQATAASLAGIKDAPDKPAEPHSSKDVILYPLPDFKGGPVIVRQFGNIINVHTLGFPSDGLRSIKVPLGVTVTVFEHEDGGGLSMELTYDMANLIGTKALGTTSLMITRQNQK